MPIPPNRSASRRLARAGLVLLVAAVGACGQTTASPTTITTVATTTTTSTTTTTTTTTTVPPEVLSETDSAPTTAEPDGDDGEDERRRNGNGNGSRIRLRNDGLGTAAFGTSESDAVASLSDQLGEPKRSRSKSQSCGNWTSAGWSALGITAHFSRGTFTGWEVVKKSTATTAEGVGVGSTMGRFRAAYGDRFEWLHDNLDNEFAIDRHGRRTFIGGVADGGDNDSRVRQLWAGYTCSAS